MGEGHCNYCRSESPVSTKGVRSVKRFIIPRAVNITRLTEGTKILRMGKKGRLEEFNDG
jgi:hypothetical protein